MLCDPHNPNILIALTQFLGAVRSGPARWMEAVDGPFLTYPGVRARRNFSARVLTRTTKGLLMLVLMRGKSQVVVVEIGGLKMELTVLDVRGDKVKLGFKAPAEFAIDR